MVIYTEEYTTISKLKIPIINIIEAVKNTNRWLQLLDIEWNILSKTLISSIITEIYPFHLCRNITSIRINPLEKSYPDIIDSLSTMDDIKHKQCIGLEVKFSNCDQWSAHHTYNTSLLAGSWRFKDSIPQILALFYANDLTNKDWHKKPNTDNNRNTPACSLKPDKLSCICYNQDIKLDNNTSKKIINIIIQSLNNNKTQKL